jgi:hypothetical protein
MNERKPAEQESLPRRQTDPIWLQDHFLATGHDVTTRNGTGTFVIYKKQAYVCTCRHIVEAASNPTMVPEAKHPTLALQIGRDVLNLSFFSVEGLKIALQAPHAERREDAVDVAIAALPALHWKLLTTRKNKTAIDLDKWREPAWKTVKVCVAAGYPDEHKELVIVDGIENVGNQLVAVAAEVGSQINRTERFITLSSQLQEPHRYYFSGMSGGPIYAIEGVGKKEVEDEELLPIGIIFEGYPSTKKRNDELDVSSAFLTEKDLFFRGLMLTPERFDDWLKRAKPI